MHSILEFFWLLKWFSSFVCINFHAHMDVIPQFILFVFVPGLYSCSSVALWCVLISERVSSSQSYLLINLAIHKSLSFKRHLVNQVPYKTSDQNFKWDYEELWLLLQFLYFSYFMKYETGSFFIIFQLILIIHSHKSWRYYYVYCTFVVHLI